MATSSRPRRSERRLKKTRPKKRKAGMAAGKPRKAVKAASKTAAPGIVETALATFAHEVRTPLTGILAISDLLATSDLDERERRWVDTIKTGAEHLASLATLFVDAARSGRSGFGVRRDFFLPPVQLTLDESLALAALAEHVGGQEQVPFTKAASRAISKIRGQLPSAIRRELEQIEDQLVASAFV